LRIFPSFFLTVVLLFWAAPPSDAASPASSQNSVFQWMEAYGKKPRPNKAPAAIKEMSQLGAFRDPEAAGFYVGFVAGVLNANPKNAMRLAREMVPLSEEDDWVVVRAAAWSELPNRHDILEAIAGEVPSRRVLIEKYISGTIPTLFNATVVPARPLRGWKAIFKSQPEGPPLPTADQLDALWGFYIATGSRRPIESLVAFLPLADEDDDPARLAIGGMAKYMLASAAVRSPKLLSLLKDINAGGDDLTARVLADVIEAAESVDAGRIRNEQMVALEDLKTKGPGSRRKVAKWGRIGEGAISLGCVAAAATGQVYLGIPCVIGGAATSAALRYWASRQ
jgi:hypothetical protein